MQYINLVPERSFVPRDTLPAYRQKHVWIYDDKASIGEPAKLEEHLHIQHSYSRPGDQQIIQILKSKSPNKIYRPGEEVEISGYVVNPEDYPLFDVQLYGMLFFLNKDPQKAQKCGHNLIQDFLLWKSANLAAKEKKFFQYHLQVPKSSIGGRYALSMNLSQNRRFPLRGNAYYWEGLREWYNRLGSMIFRVENSKNSNMFIDRDSLYCLNGLALEKLEIESTFIAKKALVIFNDHPDLEISFDLVNECPFPLDVYLSFDIMRPRLDSTKSGGCFAKFMDDGWDQYVEKECVKVNPGKKTITRKIIFGQRGQQPDHILSITATSAVAKSIVHIFIIRKGQADTSSFVWPGIDCFPLRKGKKTCLWTGFMSQDRQAAFGTIRLELRDRREKLVGRLLYKGKIDGKPRAWKNSVTPLEDYEYIKMTGIIKGENGEILDSIEREYDEKLLSI